MSAMQSSFPRLCFLADRSLVCNEVVGAALADGLGGYSHWAPFTLIIKGVEGLVICMIMPVVKTGFIQTGRAHGGYWLSISRPVLHGNWGFCRWIDALQPWTCNG